MLLCAPLDGPKSLQVYFAVAGLDVLGALDAITNRDDIIKWVYSLQIVSCESRHAADAPGTLAIVLFLYPLVTLPRTQTRASLRVPIIPTHGAAFLVVRLRGGDSQCPARPPTALKMQATSRPPTLPSPSSPSWVCHDGL